MPDFFQCLEPQNQRKKEYLQKSKSFHQEIRSKEIFQRIRQKRIVGSDGPHIEAMVKGLPLSWYDTVIYIKQNPQCRQAITKLIISKVYSVELSEQKCQKREVYFLLPETPPKNLQEFMDEIYFFAILIENQSIYSPNIFKRYLLIILEHAKSLKAIDLVFNLFLEVLKKPELNWAPIEQIVQTLKLIEKSNNKQNQKSLPISCQQVETYLHLVTNYYHFVQNTDKIRQRIKLILQKGVQNFQKIKPRLFFKFCFQLTYFENPTQKDPISYQSNSQKEPNRFFHDAMLKGGIIKAIYRYLFFSSEQKLKFLCLNIMNNLMVEYDGMVLWQKQPFNPIEKFDQQIRDEYNSVNLFQLYCKVFLTSILQLPSDQINNLFNKQTDTLDLILYILEKNNFNSPKGKQLLQRAEKCIFFMLDEGNSEIQYKIANIMLQSRWKNALSQDSDLIQLCQKILNLQT